MRWISTELYVFHHKTIASQRLEGCGSWLLDDKVYKQWKYTSRHPFLWLKGDVGTGKTQLTSMVIDDLGTELSRFDEPPPVAYFYCSRDSSEPRRADNSEVLLSILKQLACNDGADRPIIPHILSKWQQRLNMSSDHRLGEDECTDIIIEICSDRGAYIVIDALDECPKDSRQDLLEGLNKICQASTSLVRIFISSRPIKDVRLWFHKTPYLEVLKTPHLEALKTPHLEVLVKPNSADIETYSLSRITLYGKRNLIMHSQPRT